MRVVIEVKRHAKYSGIAYHSLIKKRLFSPTIGKLIKPLFRTSNITLSEKKLEKQPTLSVGIIPCDSI